MGTSRPTSTSGGPSRVRTTASGVDDPLLGDTSPNVNRYAPCACRESHPAGIEVVLSGVQMPRMNAVMERWVQASRSRRPGLLQRLQPVHEEPVDLIGALLLDPVTAPGQDVAAPQARHGVGEAGQAPGP